MDEKKACKLLMKASAIMKIHCFLILFVLSINACAVVTIETSVFDKNVTQNDILL